MKQTILFLITLLSLFLHVNAQVNDQVWYLNKKGEEVKEKKAVFLFQIRKMNDTSWENDLYEIFGPVVRKFYPKTGWVL